jgi:hypothetical protein
MTADLTAAQKAAATIAETRGCVDEGRAILDNPIKRKEFWQQCALHPLESMLLIERLLNKVPDGPAIAYQLLCEDTDKFGSNAAYVLSKHAPKKMMDIINNAPRDVQIQILGVRYAADELVKQGFENHF